MSMENLFRFVLTRPPVAQADDSPNLTLGQDTPFQGKLGAVENTRDSREARKAVAREYVASADFISDPATLPIAGKLKKIRAAFDALQGKKPLSHGDTVKAIEEAFGAKIADVRKTVEPFATKLRDSVISIKLLPEEQQKPIEELTRALRDIEVIFKTADSKDFPEDRNVLRRTRRRPLLLPTKTDLRSALSTLKKQEEIEKQIKAQADQQAQQAQGKLDKYKGLQAAVAELTALGGDRLAVTVQQEDAAELPPKDIQPTQVLAEAIRAKQAFSQVALKRADLIVGKISEVGELASVSLGEAGRVATTAVVAQGLLTGKGAFKPSARADLAFKLRPVGEGEIDVSDATQKVLVERGLRLTEDPLDIIINTLQGESVGLATELDTLLGRPVAKSFKRYGNTLLSITTAKSSVWNNIVVGGSGVIGSIQIDPSMFDFRIPSTHGSVAPSGVADLLVVKQQLVRYEGADVAHIENVLKGESKVREHTERRETEEFTLTESEVTTTEERDLESTSRLEMSRESSEVIKEDASLKAGLSVSGKYGPVVEFSASAEGAISRSKEEATKSASVFSQDVTERSSNKVAKRLLERESRRVTNEVIEKNTHSLVNDKPGAVNIAGVYQWVNKVYQAQMYNYGIRTMYEFMVPEPAMYLIESLQQAHASAIDIDKPSPFTLRADQINEWNYFGWISLYGATDVAPPPEIYITKAFDFNAGGGDDHTDYNRSGQIAIDEGYRAVFGSVGIAGNIWEDGAVCDVVVGRRRHRFKNNESFSWTTDLDSELSVVALALNTWRFSHISAAIEVKCQRTDRAMLKWQLDTHAKLTAAYNARLSEYEDKLAKLQIQAGVAIQGKNPELNLQLMNDELKKHCITILTEQNFDLFNSVSFGSYGVPQINLSENKAEGPYVRFFEQAFEWEHMTWITYPYFWGRKGQWDERISYEDVDPLFNQFLKAGYARVVVPVRLQFEGAVDHFTTFGEIWDGGPLPAIGNPLYLAIADEIAERLDRPGEEIPQGDPWFVKVPTTLVKLRPGDKLPTWKQNDAGEWVEG